MQVIVIRHGKVDYTWTKWCTSEEFDIRDIYGAATDDNMGEEMNNAKNFGQAAEVLAAYGYYHISASFISVMVQYASLLDEEGIFTEEDYKEMEKCTFEERCTKYINKLQAIGVITGLRYGLHDSFETPYLIAIAGCAAMTRQRQSQDQAKAQA